jgi:hypothetical protein
MNTHRTLTFVALASIAVAMFASLGAASPTVTKQRVAIVERIGFNGGAATFEIIPLAPGPLKHDSGTIGPSTGNENAGSVTRNGQRLTVIRGVDPMTGKQGSFEVSQKIERAELGGGYGVATGTWSFRGGTGAYARFTGGGRFAGLDLPSGRVLIRQEGYVRAG